MSTVVRKSLSVVVRPSERPPLSMSDATIKLSSLDKLNFPFVVILLYEHPISNAAITIKTALSQALVHYYPFSAGCFVQGASSSPSSDGKAGSSSHIDCTTREGAMEFITASVDCSFKQATELFGRRSSRRRRGGGGTSTTSSLLDELAVFYLDGSYGLDDPLLSVQVTEFTCDGFILGVTWSHAIADGFGIAQFLGAVGELARGLSSPSIVPIRWDEAVSRFPPLPNPVLDVIIMSLNAAQDHSLLDLLEVTIPSSFIDRIKAEFNGRQQPPCRCKTFEVATAVLWQSRARAIMSRTSPDTLFFLAFAVNMRRHVGAKGGYYDNRAMDKLVMATSGAVAGMEIIDLVKMIKRAKDQIPDLLYQKKNDESSKSQLQGLDEPYNMLLVSSWRNIGFEEADFGTGPPARVLWHTLELPPLPTCVMCPDRVEDGVKVVAACVKEEHVDAFLTEITKFT